MSCQHDCERPPVFPLPIFNRPGLDTIDYRIGTYAEMRAQMLASLDSAPVLARWTHRKADDPGIALIEGAAIVGDILTFYQRLYANEAFLRTARWRDSVADLVKLLGYRLAPGLGGHARFALAVKGDRPVQVPAGTGFKAQLDGAPKPANFETSAPATAYPHLSQFNLYRRRQTPLIVHGTDTFYVDAADPAAVKLKAGDRIMVGLARQDGAALDHTQVLTVDKAWQSFGILFVKMKGGITSLAPSLSFGPAVLSAAGAATFTSFLGSAVTSLQANAAITQPLGLSLALPLSFTGPMVLNIGGSLAARPFTEFILAAGLGIATVRSAGAMRAYKLGGSFRHFGHNAPAKEVSVDRNGHPQINSISYVRSIRQTTYEPASPALAARHMPLDGPVETVVAGTAVLVEANLSTSSDGSAPVKRVIERRIEALDRQSLAWGSASGASTVLTLDAALALTEGSRRLDYADIRGISFHAIEGAAFTLKAALQPIAAASGAELDFYGTAAEAATLDKRRLLLVGPGTALVEANVMAVEAGPTAAAAQPAFHRVTLDRAVVYRDFPHDAPTVTVYGNLVAATEGKTEDEVTLGDGDGRQVFQTFPLPKPPLTYLLDPALDPPQAPELKVYVDGRLWRRVETLFASGPGDPVYVVRQDADGKSYVQFGDGKTGARLSSGRGNVVAIFRTGSGSHGPLKADAKPQPAARLPGLDKVFMPEPATGGAAPESEDSARIAAPGRMQSLARMVSLADMEAEALAIAGVLKARAAWSILDAVPHVVVTVLTQSRSAADANAVADTLLALYRARGPARHPVTVVQGKRRRLRIGATVGYDVTYRQEDVRAAILDALGAAADGSERTDGLFGWQRRQFGEGAHGSQVVAAIQNVSGVAWVRLTALGSAGLTLLSGLLLGSARVAPERSTIACPPDSILALDAADLALSLAATDLSKVS
jgi:predicted phage baseplate assembly protein